jgi:helicase
MEEEIIRKVLEISKFKELNPIQKESLKKGLLERKNLVIATPTASGKTLIAEIAALNTFYKKLGKTIYLVPLVSLANEKFNEFKEKYEKLGIKVAMSIGDYDDSDPWLAGYDIIILSNEKCDSLIRHGAEWIRDVGLVVCDEIHMLTDISRGPTLEIILTRLKEIVPNAQYLALSATIKNCDEIAKWLNAELVTSDWRPVKLYQGVAYPWKIKFLEKEEYELNPNLPIEEAIVENTLNLRKQALLFVSTRKNAESLAERLSELVNQKLTKNEKEELKKLADEIENVLESPTKQCKKIAKCVRNGVAFHHAGLLYKQKSLIEENFRKGLIKVIVATVTLAYGVNLPSFRVVMRDLKRYYPGIGAEFVPILEVQQMLGRAGRPKYDSFGEGIILAKSEEEAEELTEYYIHGEPEEITSKLAVEPVLRMHVLALIATEFCKSNKSLVDFFSKTFFAFQYGKIDEIEEKLDEILNLLKKWKFIEIKKDKLIATIIGKRVSQLYIDPLTASIFIDSLKKAIKKEIEPFSFLQVICSVPEMRPLLSVKVSESNEIEKFILKNKSLFLQKVPKFEEWEFEEFMKTVKTALMFDAWINEASEDEILNRYKVAPGELRSRLEIADWLVYSLHELALLLGYKEILKHIRKLRVRLQYGVKEELIPLVKLKDIGRVRARILWKNNLRSLSDLRKIPYEALSLIIGPKIAKSIKDQVEGKEVKERRELQTTLDKKYFKI